MSGTIVSWQSSPDDWRQRAEHYAEACELFAECLKHDPKAPKAYHPDDKEASILRLLLRKHPVTVKQADMGRIASAPIIGARLSALEEAKLVCRPRGEKGGYALTDEGQATAKALPAE